jgi:hypothetical protein
VTSTLTLLDGDRPHELRAHLAGARVLLEPADVRDALGWEVHDGLLCNDAMCVPLDDPAALLADGGIDLEGLARALDRPVAVDVDERVAVLGASARERAQALGSQQAPDFTLPDLEGRPHTLAEHRGTKILLVAWASW